MSHYQPVHNHFGYYNISYAPSCSVPISGLELGLERENHNKSDCLNRSKLLTYVTGSHLYWNLFQCQKRFMADISFQICISQLSGTQRSENIKHKDKNQENMENQADDITSPSQKKEEQSIALEG